MAIRVQRILVALDNSEGSAAIVEYACAIARGLTAELTVLHIYEPPNEMVGVVPGATMAGEIAAERAAGSALLDAAAKICSANGLAHVERVLECAGSASRAIVAELHAGRYDLLVMGTHGRSALSRILVGSVAQHVLSSTTRPVLLVHLPPARR